MGHELGSAHEKYLKCYLSAMNRVQSSYWNSQFEALGIGDFIIQEKEKSLCWSCDFSQQVCSVHFDQSYNLIFVLQEGKCHVKNKHTCITKNYTSIPRKHAN